MMINRQIHHELRTLAKSRVDEDLAFMACKYVTSAELQQSRRIFDLLCTLINQTMS